MGRCYYSLLFYNVYKIQEMFFTADICRDIIIMRWVILEELYTNDNLLHKQAVTAGNKIIVTQFLKNITFARALSCFSDVTP